MFKDSSKDIFGLLFALLSFAFALGGIVAGEKLENTRIYKGCLEKNSSMTYAQAKATCIEFTK